METKKSVRENVPCARIDAKYAVARLLMKHIIFDKIEMRQTSGGERSVTGSS